MKIKMKIKNEEWRFNKEEFRQRTNIRTKVNNEEEDAIFDIPMWKYWIIPSIPAVAIKLRLQDNAAMGKWCEEGPRTYEWFFIKLFSSSSKLKTRMFVILVTTKNSCLSWSETRVNWHFFAIKTQEKATWFTEKIFNKKWGI